MSESHRFEGFSRPRFTQTPDELFDELLPDLSLVELKVLLYIVRRTFGFKKDSDMISVAQMESGITTRDGRRLDRGTGLSTAGVRKGLRGLLDRGVIVAVANTDDTGASLPTTYALRFKEEGVHTRTPSPVTPVHPPGDTGVDPQETVEQETEESLRIERFIRDFAREFRDRAPLSSSLTRAVNLYESSNLALEDYTAMLYEARAKTKAAVNVRNKMAYFFEVLENALKDVS